MSARQFAQNVARWLNQTVHVSKSLGRDEFGNPKWGDPMPVKARVEGQSVRTVDVTGVEITADYTVLTQAVIGKEDRIWLPWEDPTDLDRARLPARIRPAPYFDGEIVFTEVWVS